MFLHSLLSSIYNDIQDLIKLKVTVIDIFLQRLSLLLVHMEAIDPLWQSML